MTFLRKIPWWMKIGAKLMLSRIPASYRLWQRVGLFRHGFMVDPEYAVGIYRKHHDRSDFGRKGEPGHVVVELGPGDTVGTALVAASLGAGRTYLVDVGRFARPDLEPYIRLAAHLRAIGLAPPDIDRAESLDDVLSACNAVYMTSGVASLREIPSSSVDLIFSNAVLEHVRRAEMGDLASEIRRLLRPDGATSHTVDLQDHLGGGLNNLRFPDRVWESTMFASSGFYTNRLRRSDVIGVFASVGLPPRVVREERWASVPIPRRSLSPMFHGYSDDELAVWALDFVATPSGGGGANGRGSAQ